MIAVSQNLHLFFLNTGISAPALSVYKKLLKNEKKSVIARNEAISNEIGCEFAWRICMCRDCFVPRNDASYVVDSQYKNYQI